MPETKLEATCDVGSWTNLSVGEQMLLQLKASVDPVFFWKEPRLGNYPLWDSKAEILKEFYKYDKKTGKRKYSEMIFMAGMNSGKSQLGAQIVLYELAKMLMMKNPQMYYNLGPNTEITFGNIANSLTQAQKTVFRKSLELIANSPFLYSHMIKPTTTTVKFEKNLTVEALGSNLGSAVGRRMKVFVADEIDDYEHPEDTYFKLSRSGASFSKWNENIRVMIGSPKYEGGFLVSTYRKAEREKWSNTMLLWKNTMEMNPEITEESMEVERLKDPDRFARDILAQPISAKENLFNTNLLLQCAERSPRTNIFIGEPDKSLILNGFEPQLNYDLLYPADDAQEYIIAVDPSVRNDAFGISVGYLNMNGLHKVIGSTIFKARINEELDTKNIEDIIKPILERLPVKYYIFDVYLHSSLQQLVSRYGVIPVQHTLNLTDWIYTRNDLYNDILSVPYSKYLFDEFTNLFIINNKKVDHPRNGSKDQADTIAQFNSFIRRKEEEDRMKAYNANSLTHMVASF